MRVGGHFDRWGHGLRHNELPETVPVSWMDFSGGVDLRETGDEKKTHDGLDLEVRDDGRLVVMPGVEQSEDLVGRDVQRLITHGSLDNRTELVLLAPPEVGVKEEGATVWTDIGLQEGRWYAWTVFGGTLILTDGYQVWTREPRKEFVVSDTIPIARTYATFAARVVAGHVVLDGDLEPQLMRWSSADSNPRDWEGLGSGFELLLDDMSAGDRVVRGVPMGLDFMAIFMRRSIWTGQRTGIASRPIDFRPRVPGVGCAAAATARATPLGVLFLSDKGVELFNGNHTEIVSEQINPQLLPLDYDNIGQYKAAFNPQTQRYTLLTPSRTFVLDLRRARWYRWTLTAADLVTFAEQFDRTTWEDLLGNSWADLAGTTWYDFSPEEGPQLDMVYAKSDGEDSELGEESDSVSTVFGVAMTPTWTFPFARGRFLDQLLTVKELMMEYSGEGKIDFYLKDIEDNLDLIVEQTLVNYTRERPYRVPIMKTGRGFELQVRIASGRPVVRAFGSRVMPRGRWVQPVDAQAREYYPDFT